eukprot:CAMPEP_0113463324 /NCGR_PEP_ID=MMETSP0014_2-20120614/12582_1 /TAXON_ID=2857 /ORGANISM="Nitzschia sp." /LENGTH=1288 /DNA_ID=CAMNT_0000355281 /DNA_START=311 /DNA_END=4177 /DNA_ORIENTATION=+ /assembly_acc=CAM_ASM_000159
MSICRTHSESLRLLPSPSVEPRQLQQQQQQQQPSLASSSSAAGLKRAASSLLLQQHQTTTEATSSTARLLEEAIEITGGPPTVRRFTTGTFTTDINDDDETSSNKVVMGSIDSEIEQGTAPAPESGAAINNSNGNVSALLSVHNPLAGIDSPSAGEARNIEPPSKKQKVDSDPSKSTTLPTTAGQGTRDAEQQQQQQQPDQNNPNASASVVTSSTEGASSQQSTCQSSTTSTTASSHESFQNATTPQAGSSMNVGQKESQISSPAENKGSSASITSGAAPVATNATAAGSSAGGAPSQPDDEALPLKALTFAHLRAKYIPELEYMLREFRKLERQLLGAKGAAKLEESAGSRERREKLHTFILHLDDTIRQIELGFKLEAEGKYPFTVTVEQKTQDGSAASKGEGSSSSDNADNQKEQSGACTVSTMTTEKEQQENVQKIEEHILANLLPVKIRLKKQLAAQQGATQNPAGMPALRRGSLQPPAAAQGKGTFAEAAEKRRQQAEAARLAAQEQRERAERRLSDPTQFGKPLSGGGSALTKNLHGSTLGSSQRTHGHGVGSTAAEQADKAVAERKPAAERKILYAGMVPQSSQQESGLSAASGVHDVLTTGSLASSLDSTSALLVADPSPMGKKKNSDILPRLNIAESKTASKRNSKRAGSTPSPLTTLENQPLPSLGDDISLTAEDSLFVLRKKRRKRKVLRLARRRERERNRQHAASVLSQPSVGAVAPPKASAIHSKAVSSMKGPKKGPKTVEYICSLCNETYTTTNDCNPWWALSQHDCPKCRKTQVPRIDINSPANAIDYHPALLAHLEENGGRSSKGSSSKSSTTASTEQSSTLPIQYPASSLMDDSESDTDLSELSDDELSLSSMISDDDTWPAPTVSAAERAELEHFGYEYRGPIFTDDHSAKLLALMSHASTCPCRHKSEEHRDTCRSVKYMMLHVRDCPGTTANNDVCPFPWCRKTKHLLYHLISCRNPEKCPICSPNDLPKNLKSLVGISRIRAVKHREDLIEAQNVAMVCKPVDAPAGPTPAANAAESSKAGLDTQQLASSSKTAVESASTPNGGSAAASRDDESMGLGSTKASDEQLAQAALAAAATVDTAEMEKDPSTQAALAAAESTKLVDGSSNPSSVATTPVAGNAPAADHQGTQIKQEPADETEKSQGNDQTSSLTVDMKSEEPTLSVDTGDENCDKNAEPASDVRTPAAVTTTIATTDDIATHPSSNVKSEDTTNEHRNPGPDATSSATGCKNATADSTVPGVSSASPPSSDSGADETTLPRTSSAVEVS